MKTLMYEKMIWMTHCLQALLALGLLCVFFGCEADSFLDPSKTGYFERTPTSMPILNRIDIIEREVGFAPSVTKPTPEDLVPNRLEYRLAPGDVVRIEIFELILANQTDLSIRVVDQSGAIRLPALGDVQAANLTVQELQEEIIDRLRERIGEPIVTVVLEDGRSFQFTIYGAVAGTGIYQLTRPDFRVMDAISMAGGTSSTTQQVFVIREVALDEAVNPLFEEGSGSSSKTEEAVNIDDIDRLIEELDGNSSPEPPAGTLKTEDSPTEPPKDDSPATAVPSPGARGLRLAQVEDPPIDVDDVTDAPETTPTALQPVTSGASHDPVFYFDEKTQSWIRGTTSHAVGVSGQDHPVVADVEGEGTAGGGRSYLTRIIEIDYPALSTGDSNLNIVIRPGDRIYVAVPEMGVVYIDGEIARPGVFQLPMAGRLTLSRLVAAAGGLNGLAIPERVDLIRKIGPDRESAIRVNLAAIRNRAEPDIYMRQDDHVIIGTNFFATPLAIMRNGFRMTYGFGFLLDRNFGNDVFGAPPSNFFGSQ